MRLARTMLLTILIVVTAFPQSAKESNDPLKASTFTGLKFRSLGPALMSGRISSIAVHPKDPTQYFIAAASGGVWKTINSGTSWSPVFDNEGSYSIGVVAIDPSNPNVVWVGTGENNSQRSVGYGDGVYRSDDGGKSWKNVGLKKSEHIARILFDPRNTGTVYVASQGPLWGPGGDRGLFKTTDGGATWKNVLSISENTGVTDVVMDQKNPDVLLAASYQRRRHVATFIDGGPECAIYKSTDAGTTWTKLKNGLPSVDMGRIGLAMAPADQNIVYAIIESTEKKGGVFRSSDQGATWEKRNDFDQTAMYYSTLYVDPKNSERIYVMNFNVMLSDDGGKTLKPIGEKWKHVDSHAMWIDPSNTNHYLVGCDGGLYESWDRAQTWAFKANLPITQFYKVTVDSDKPFYHIYGGTQDNNTIGGPSRTCTATGIANSDWFITVGGDGFQPQVDPEDPNIVYSQYQYGGIVRFDRRSGEMVGIQPQPGKGEPPLRWNWDSPLMISPHSHTRVYFAANRLYRSDDRGDSWKAISGDLTRQIDRNKLPVMGKIWNVDAVAKYASISLYGNCTALSESPKKEGLLYIGTDDGLVQITENNGVAWRKIEKFSGVPEMTYVSRLLASQHDVNTVYASFDNHKNADFSPYLLKSTDAGKSWVSIKGDLPANGPVLAIAEDHVNPNLLFAGTEFGVFFTIDGGKKWIQLKGGMPTIAVRDLAIQKRENDLVAATFGRGFAVLDDYSPLRTVSAELLSKEAYLFPVKSALQYIQSLPLGDRGKASQGESYFTAENPPYGAVFTYYLKEAMKTRKEIRKDAEKEAEKNNEVSPYPTADQLRAEDAEEEPSIGFSIADAKGDVIRKINGANSAGMNRISWNLRYPDPAGTQPSADSPADDPPSGPLVLPGEYTVTMFKRVDGVQTQLGDPQKCIVLADSAATLPAENRLALYEFQKKVARLQRSVNGAVRMANDVRSRLGKIKTALHETPAPVESLRVEASALERTLDGILRSLSGDNSLRMRNENTPSSISEKVGRIVDEQSMSTSRATKTHMDLYAQAGEEFGIELQKLRTLVEVDLVKLENAMEAAGAPWTPGRMPVWKEE